MRLDKLQKIAGKTPVFLASLGKVNNNLFYFTGVDEEAFALLFTPHETIAYGNTEYPWADKTVPSAKLKKHFRDYVKENKIKKIGVDENDLLSYQRLSKKNFSPVPLAKRFAEARKIKEPEEKRKIRKAQAITKECFNATKNKIFNKTESHAAGLFELEARKKGSALDAFPPIVASGENSASPHARPTARKIGRNDVVVVDIGATCEHYCGDFSSTIYEGKDRETTDAVEAVREAQKAAMKAARPGAKGKGVNEAAEKVISEYGFGDYSFRKARLRIGHHVGLEVHDGPCPEEDVLKKGMVFTIEPGIYVPKKFGVRFEEIVFL
ncbi:M24 family metallopeptidase [Candidatus Micrarchaeota archaeon]|nr:M24 family metallopeptidase [Candidatus Micrarchaeota archaeon]